MRFRQPRRRSGSMSTIDTRTGVSRIAVGGQGWDATAWLVIAGWTAVLSALAVWVDRRDSGRP